MKESLAPIYWIVRRELSDQMRDWRILFPLIVLSLFFPIAMTGIAQATVNFINQYGGNLVIEQLVPFSILVVGFFPTTLSLTISIEGIVGERERGTVEPLLATPLANWQIYMGKFIAGLIAPLFSIFFAITLYLILIARRDIPLPSPQMLGLLYLISVSNALLMVSGATFLSAQSTSVRGATLSSSFIILPVSFVLEMEAYLLFWKNNFPLFLILFFVLIFAFMFLRLGLIYFERENLFGREVDELNLRRSLRYIWEAFRGEAGTIWEWYRYELPRSLREMRYALILFLALFPLGSMLGVYVADSMVKPLFPLPETQSERETLLKRISVVLSSTAREDFQQEDALSMGYILRHNLTVVFGISFLGIMSFGIFGVLAYLLNTGLLGIVWRVLEWMALPPLNIYLFGVLPHGILELPAMVISFATVFYLGVRTITPSNKTISKILAENLAFWLRITVGIVIPLFFLAAMVESSVTPILLKSYLWTLLR
ncbi:MAG: stage II sporulation protein M [Anaerolineales bacterium]